MQNYVLRISVDLEDDELEAFTDLMIMLARDARQRAQLLGVVGDNAMRLRLAIEPSVGDDIELDLDNVNVTPPEEEIPNE